MTVNRVKKSGLSDGVGEFTDFDLVDAPVIRTGGDVCDVKSHKFFPGVEIF